MKGVVAVIVAALVILLLIGFWPFYSQPWMEVVLGRIWLVVNRVSELILVAIAAIAFIALQGDSTSGEDNTL